MNRAYVLGLFDTGVGVIRALAREGVEVRGFDHRVSQPGFSSRFGTHAVCPDPALEPDALASFLVERARAEAAPPILYPTSDAFVSFVSAKRDVLEPVFRHALPSREVVAAVLDKGRQYVTAQAAGIAIAATHSPQSLEELTALTATLAFPVVVKPHVGHVWRQQFRQDKALLVHDARELVALYRDIFAARQSALIQSLILGPNTNHCKVCAYIDMSGMPRIVCCMRKVRQYPIDFGVGTMMESVSEPELAEIGLRFFRAVGWRGPGSIEFKRDDRDGAWKLIELNPRLWQQNGFATHCGANLPMAQYRDLTGQAPVEQSYRVGVRWLDEFRDLRSAIVHYRTGRMTLRQWVASYGSVRAFALLATDDMGPFLAAARGEMRAMWRRVSLTSGEAARPTAGDGPPESPQGRPG
jgi:D-aspartate ligase